MNARAWCAAAAASVLLAAPLDAQDADLARLTAAVRAATSGLRDTAAARAAGYRPFGPDFPTMGRHWVSVARVMAGGVDPSRPPILEYATVDGRSALVGVGFATLVSGSAVPDALPVPASAWHFHSGTIDGESFRQSHASHAHGGAPRIRIAVLHLWAWERNPDGLTATHNWALPFRRLGLAVPPVRPTPETVHGVALAGGAAPFYLASARSHGLTDARHTAAVGTALDGGARRIGALLHAQEGRRLTPALAHAVAEEWRRTWDEVERRTSPAVRRLAQPRE